MMSCGCVYVDFLILIKRILGKGKGKEWNGKKGGFLDIR